MWEMLGKLLIPLLGILVWLGFVKLVDYFTNKINIKEYSYDPHMNIKVIWFNGDEKTERCTNNIKVVDVYENFSFKACYQKYGEGVSDLRIIDIKDDKTYDGYFIFTHNKKSLPMLIRIKLIWWFISERFNLSNNRKLLPDFLMDYILFNNSTYSDHTLNHLRGII